jgi:hypothetical protein
MYNNIKNNKTPRNKFTQKCEIVHLNCSLKSLQQMVLGHIKSVARLQHDTTLHLYSNQKIKGNS